MSTDGEVRRYERRAHPPTPVVPDDVLQALAWMTENRDYWRDVALGVTREYLLGEDEYDDGR